MPFSIFPRWAEQGFRQHLGQSATRAIWLCDTAILVAICVGIRNQPAKPRPPVLTHLDRVTIDRDAKAAIKLQAVNDLVGEPGIVPGVGNKYAEFLFSVRLRHDMSGCYFPGR